MHILLTDLLTCPRCGPEFGLILLGDRIEDRRVLDGLLGCPNCREKYPVWDGFGDLRAPPRNPLPPVMEPPAAVGGDEATRVAALLGVREGPGHLVLVGPVARVAPHLAAMLENVEVVTISGELRAWEEATGVSRLAAGPGLPFYSRRIRGVVLDGAAGRPYLDHALRVVGPGGRVVVLDAPDGARAALEDAGLETVLDDRGVVAAVRS